jgi:hypothetical protein
MSQFDLDSVIVSFNGRQIKGTGESFIKISPSGDVISAKACVDGHQIVSMKKDRSGKVELTLRWNSPSNAILNQELEAKTQGSFGCVLPDGTKVSGTKCYIQSRPEISASEDPGDWVWTIFIEDMKYQPSSGTP